LTKKNASVTPGVTVIVLTNGSRKTLDVALSSISRQSFKGVIEVLLILDKCDLSDLAIGNAAITMRRVRIDLSGSMATIERVAKLRDMALRLCETPLVCFLDDDNCWSPDHLETLHSKMHTTGAPAVHSWRRISPKSEWRGDRFPWLPHGSTLEQDRFDLCKGLGIIEPGSDIIRDTAYGETTDGDASMVDLGTWLLRTDILRLFGLSANPFSFSSPVEGIGEDDILLTKFKSAAIPIECTERATLEYALGGFSNNSTSAENWRSS
jgi:hypothetical protein